MHRSLVLVLAAVGLSGCGYRMGTLTTGNVRTVHVAMFANDTFYRDLEVQLTDAVRQELRRRTNLRLVGRDEAASLLTGRIVNVRQNVLTHDAAGAVFAKDVTVYVDFEWRDQRHGTILARGVNVAVPARMVATKGETVETAAAESLTDAAKTIVDRLQGDW